MKLRLLSGFLFIVVVGSCHKQNSEPGTCAQPPFPYTLAITGSDPCAAGGTATINGGSGNYQFRLNGGPFQTARLFTDLAPGHYRFDIKGIDCIYTDTFTVPALPAGPLFTSVRNLLTLHCNGCHNAAYPQYAPDFTKDCNIVQYAPRIMARAVFGNPTPMPETGLLPLGQVNQLTLWYASGAKYIN